MTEASWLDCPSLTSVLSVDGTGVNETSPRDTFVGASGLEPENSSPRTPTVEGAPEFFWVS